jgi:hypothetical protein
VGLQIFLKLWYDLFSISKFAIEVDDLHTIWCCQWVGPPLNPMITLKIVIFEVERGKKKKLN